MSFASRLSMNLIGWAKWKPFRERMMDKNSAPPSKFWAYMAVLFGGFLLLAGCTATVGFLGVPILDFGEDLLGEQLGQMAAMFLGLVCGSLALVHGFNSILKRRSGPFRLAPAYIFGIVFALVLGLGNLLLNFGVSEEFLFPPVFLLGAALPTVAVVAWAARRLGWPITWRQAALALVAGSTLSILIAILLETTLPFLAYNILYPLEDLAYTFSDILDFGSSGFLERLFFSPMILVFLLFTAFEAPLPEEFAKALTIPFFGRKRIHSEKQAFIIGLLSGAGFAILENMLYEGLYAQWSGWSWGGITLLRGLGSVLHPLCTGIVTLGWFRMREGGFKELLKAYGIAVGLHTLWNGGFLPFVYLSGVENFTGAYETFSVYGEAIEIVLIVFLAGLSLGLWWILRRIVANMAVEEVPDLAPVRISTRALAFWGFVCALIIIPIGAAIGPAWESIREVLILGG
jgi:RsiW-degrading membrane proteinase PrsW (M82 family)